ncbi:4'-phosphopantetheinyl transferase superfamily protein [Algoriphagus halophytocola]|uniref:4'-phosphopantetheinyl transferase superfamily protein n=1 Tax=Algoriphagus halophytocola TaxID=2991499 RepID=A0ABY6MLC0_9BACT|nr:MULTISPECIES: 4'-phosphopantetheinyl transferase superfamily protein [unclassified Algoriphagus]UZD23476.1 4'-phosphopantetheinyl transferase superfamily protein [Algoriphagus sp. TR-M5]WBL44770.1 4'-phosphopantetheinyl transferase superfamily protein [Algoriphagus sp. TR-M9]
MRVELWVGNLSTIPDTNPEYLSNDELKRLEKLVYQKHRDLFIKRRTMLRKLAASYLDLSPKSIRFGYSPLGKPFIAFSKEKLYFNSSHSRDHVAIGFSREGKLGVDCEFLDPEVEAELISSHFFAPEEISIIQNSSEKKLSEVFFKHWCIKEALIKYLGKGLSFPLDQVLVRSVNQNPWLEIREHNSKPPKQIYAVKYLSAIPNYGLAVVGGAEELKVEIKDWKG